MTGSHENDSAQHSGNRDVRSDSDEKREQQGHQDPVVSVIVIFFDPGPFLGEAIESIFQQTFTKWEILLVDDGSSDRATAAAKRYASGHPTKIRYLEHPRHENRGMSASRNLGISAAKGRYIAFLDADDVYLPRRLEEHVKILDKLPEIDMVQSDHLWWSEWQEQRDRSDEDYRRPFPWPRNQPIAPPDALITVLAAPLSATATCSITLRRSAVLSVGGFEDAFRALYEDQVFLTKIYLEKTAYVIPECLAKIRVHPNSCTNSVASTAHLSSGEWQRENRALVKWQKAYIADRGVADPLLNRLIHHREIQLQRLAFNGYTVMLRGLLKRYCKAILPTFAYIAYMRRRRRIQERKTNRQFYEVWRLLRPEHRQLRSTTSSSDRYQILP